MRQRCLTLLTVTNTIFQDNEIIPTSIDGRKVTLGSGGKSGNSLQGGLWVQVQGITG